MSIWSDMQDRNGMVKIRKEYEDLPPIEFSPNLNYSKEDKSRIKQPIIDLYQTFRVFPIKKKKKIVNEVFVSEKRKYLGEVLIEKILLPEKEEEWERKKRKLCEIKIPVLGEYIPFEKQIILYINNIKDISNTAPVGFYGNLLTIVRYVYLHELMHAYFDREENKGHKYLYEIEEPFAEFGALLCMKELVSEKKADSDELDWALYHVDSKKDVDIIRCYSYGVPLFNRYKDQKEKAEKMLESYL